MLNKVGSAFKIASATAEAPIDLKIDKVIEPKKEGTIYFRCRAISAGDQGPKGTKWNYNGNLDYFSRAELLKAYATFCGRNLFLNHDTSSPLKSVGKVIDSYPVEDPEDGQFYIECLAKIDKDLHPELAAMILNGDLNSVSMGASCGTSMCSICGVTIHSDQDNRCWHMSRLGQKFAAEVDMPEYQIKKGEETPSFCINSELTFSELSIVSVPADSAALIKTVIAGFKDRLVKTASKNPDTQQILAELEWVFSLLPKEAQLEIKKQICSEIGSCKVLDNTNLEKQPTEKSTMENKKEAKIKVEAAAYDALVHALNQADDGTLASLDLFNAMEGAGFTAGRTKDGKHERQVFYTALHSAIEKGWVSQVEPGVYHLTDEGKKRAQALTEWMGEDVWPGKGRLGPKKDKTEEPKVEEPASPEQMEAPTLENVVPSEEPKAEPEAAVSAPKKEKAPRKKEVPKVEAPKPVAPDHNPGCECEECAAAREGVAVVEPASLQPSLEAKVEPAINSILQKLSGLEYEKLQEHVAQKLKPRDSTMTNLKAEPVVEVAKVAEVPANLKSHEEGVSEVKPAEAAKADDMAKDLPAPAKDESEPKKEDAHEAKEVKEEKDEVQKLDEAAKLIKEVKQEIKEELKDNKAEEVKLETPIPEMPELPAMPAMASAKPALTAKFTRTPFLSKSFWTVYEGDKSILRASVGDICGKHLPEMRTLVVSAKYGDRLIARIQADGLDKIATLLNANKAPEAKKVEAAKVSEPHAEIKTSYEAGEHLVAKTEEKAVEKEAAKDSPETLSQAEKASAEPEGAKAGQAWDKSKNLFKSDKVESDEAKAKEVGKEAKLEKGEMTLSEAEKASAHPTGGIKPDLMTPVPEAKATKEVGKEAKLEPGEQTLDKAEKPAAPDAFKPKMGTESSILSDEAKAKEIGREAALATEVEASKQRIAKLEADLVVQNTQLQQEKLERALEAKMQKCRKLVEELVRRDLLAENQDLVEKFVKGGESLLDARKSALKETIDLQLSAFMQMPDSLLKVQAETIGRMKKVAAPTSTHLRIPIQGQFNPDASDSDWMQNLPWA